MKKKMLKILVLSLLLAIGMTNLAWAAQMRMINNSSYQGLAEAYPATGGNMYFVPSMGAIVSCDQTVTAANIPEQINGVTITTINGLAFAYCEQLTSVTIPNSVTKIGHGSFVGCKSLTGITIPNSVTEIGDFSFNGCESLSSITIPNGVTEIGGGYFTTASL